MKIEEALHQRFIEKKLTLSAAESCTGGSFSARLTQLPGASQYFLGSIISYSNAMKSQWLGVSETLLKEKGAVSAEVVTEMLKGLLAQTGSDYGVAVSGIAGPNGGTVEKPVGTVWCAVGRGGSGGEIRVWKIHAYGRRKMVIESSVNALIAELLVMSA
jgi:PncC family amidohydrolase